jgi:Protein of unknown function (DUF1592)/Protein of unknown function (DUF1588)/Protein of unknown function (DUF1587)/Protein of unknown function (DUF1585)/Protein of unknown function (DUF1595)
MPDCFWSASSPVEKPNRLAGRVRRVTVWSVTVVLLAALMPGSGVSAAADLTGEQFREKIQPILEDRCFACHGNGNKKGKVSLDGVESDQARLHDRDLWWGVLKNVRAGIMPPADKPQPSTEERRLLEDWIKFGAFGIDPKDPDPGRVTVRRLNRTEYHNTIRDLIGVDFDTTAEFPPDDTGHGFDNIGDVLTLSPLLLEKYLAAATTIIARAVPTVPKVVAHQVIPGQRFRRGGDGKDATGPPSLSYYEPATVSATVPVEHDGRYQVILEVSAIEKYVDGVNDYNRCRLLFRADGAELARREFVRQDGKLFRFEADRDWKAGPHTLTIEVQPLTPKEKQVRSLAFRIQSATLRGPMDERYWVRPPEHFRFFPGDIPQDADERQLYARELLGRFAARAFRRPVDDATKDRLTALAKAVSAQGGQTFEAGAAQAMAAVLTSPRFLFREEDAEPGSTDRYPLVDEYGLASRLSYFLWSSMPDDELIRLAGQHKLRANLPAQVARMLADPRSKEFFRHFVGQWLQARDIEGVLINTRAVITNDEPPDPEAERRRKRFRELIQKPTEKLTDAEKKELQDARASFGRGFRRFREFELTGELRRAMRSETEMLFEHIVRGNRSLLELLDSNYTFLNERLAKHYGIEGVKGDNLRRVDLPAGSPRGGILTQGTVLAVTSNPDRTSPVKRGLFILDNILGSPPPPPPPNIPSLEEAGKKITGRTLSLRESMVLHRNQPTCASCHARMDPLGLALENFNALGRWRDKERAGPIDASGKLLTGESFKEVKELKRILVERRRRDFYRCLSEKMLTYALGRGLEAYDVQAVDTIVERIEKADGGASALIAGIVESVPFQKRRRSTAVDSTELSDRGAGQASDLTK